MNVVQLVLCKAGSGGAGGWGERLGAGECGRSQKFSSRPVFGAWNFTKNLTRKCANFCKNFI